jgi:hypothetical protein
MTVLSDFFHAIWNLLTPPLSPAILITLLATGGIVALIWRAVPAMGRQGGWAGIILLAFLFVDWGLSNALPRLGLSFGPPTSQFIVLLVARLMLAILLAGSIKLIGPIRLIGRLAPRGAALGLGLLLAFNGAGLGLEWYTTCYEPFDLQVTKISVPGPALLPDRPLRIVQLTDIHVERITRRERELLARIEALQPDLIALTGDYVNIDYNREPRARADTKAVLAQLHAPYGVYAVSGTTAVDLPGTLDDLFAGTEVIFLQDEARRLDLAQGPLYLVGVSNFEAGRDKAMMLELAAQIPPEAYAILLYHEPKLPEAAAEAGIDLYLAGHTHGGQVRLPLWGPLIRLERFGLHYVKGQFTFGGLTLYVSRGLGMEGLSLPRMRLLCPPEIVVVDIE